MQTMKWLNISTHAASVGPFALLIWNYWHNQMTVNPIQYLTFWTGKAALVLLVLTLACTPVNTLFGFRQVLALRKPLGLYAFAYACLHLLTFVGLDYGFDIGLLEEAVLEKRYALAGFAAFLSLVPLAITSTRGWMKRLGKNWKRLHRLIYIAGLLAVVHFVWSVKSDIREPLAYGTAVAFLLVFRLAKVREALIKVRGRLGSSNRIRFLPAGNKPLCTNDGAKEGRGELFRQ